MPVSAGVRRDQVVAIVANLSDGREQVGTGYLVGPDLVLTAHHCTHDARTGESAAGLRILRSIDGSLAGEVAEVVADPALDVAVLRLARPVTIAGLEVPRYAGVDRSRSGILMGCEAIGYPLFQRDPEARIRGTGEVHGTIYQTDGAESGRLLLREPLIRPMAGAGPPDQDASGVESLWGGFSGALVFYAGRGLGIVVEHHPRQGDAALQLVAFDRLAQLAEVREETRRVVDLLGLSAADALPLISAEEVEPLENLLEVLDGDDLPFVAAVDPYRLGATRSIYADPDSDGRRDPYVPRTHNDVDDELRSALEPGRLVIVTGPSKAGKTRTAHEAVRSSWPDARLIVPSPSTLGRLLDHPRLQVTGEPVVVWFDDLDRFLGLAEPLTLIALNRLTARPGPTILVATLRQEARARLAESAGELARDARLLLSASVEIDLQPTGDDPAEQLAGAIEYPDEDWSSGVGLAERLAGVPALLQRYLDDRRHNPLRHAIVQVAVDWARAGMSRPIPEDDLCQLALDTEWELHPELDHSMTDALEAVRTARQPPAGAGRVAMLATHPGPGRTRGYRPFDYLVAADDGQGRPERPIPDGIWTAVLKRCDPAEAFEVGTAAQWRDLPGPATDALVQAAEGGEIAAARDLAVLFDAYGEPDAARDWYQLAADAGDTNSMINVALMLEHQDPADFAGARRWYERAALAGDVDAMIFLAGLCAYRMDSQDLTAALAWAERAAVSGNTSAMSSLGLLLAFELDPPDLTRAEGWLRKAGEAFEVSAMYRLGRVYADLMDPPDLPAAAEWYERAAIYGHAHSMIKLGMLFATRMDPPDLEKANYWFFFAFEEGELDALRIFDLVTGPPPFFDPADDMPEPNFALAMYAVRDVPPDWETAVPWFERAAERGHTDAMLILGEHATVDLGDLGAARRWYERAAKAGRSEAMTSLGRLYASEFDPPDLKKARGWLERAAKAGDVVAMNALGRLLARQLDPPDLTTARVWYQRAAEAGLVEAMTELGDLLSELPDPQAARIWYDRAAAAEAAAAEAVARERRATQTMIGPGWSTVMRWKAFG